MDKKISIKKYVIFSILAACFLWTASSEAQDYPKTTVQLVVPFAPGGATDIFWRTVIDSLSRNLNGTIAILNKTGGGGVVGTSSVVNSKPDGYTLAAGNSDTLNITPLFTPDIPFDTINDLTYIAKLAIFLHTLSVRTESPFKTLEEVAAFAKANPKKLKAGTPGVGTSPYMALHIFNQDAKVEITPVAFGGGGEVVPQILGGHVDVAFISIPPIKSQVLAGKIRILAMFSPKRHPAYPDIPTAVEKGYKQTIITTGIGLVGPKGLPSAIVKKWEEAAEKTMKDPNVISAIQKFDYVADFKRGEIFKKEIVEEMAFFKTLMEKAGIKPEAKK
jgi:tripartite-type tricarboxylate transporter receptor subunit TctC